MQGLKLVSGWLAVLGAVLLRGQGAEGLYTNVRNKWFEPSESTTFQLVELGQVNLTFLDRTHLEGYDAQEMVDLGEYRVESRIGMIEKCNSINFQNVDGILGFGWFGGNKSSALLKTLTQKSRPGWGVTQAEDFEPMARKFSFTANETQGELHLGGYDPDAIEGEMKYFPMTSWFYGVNVTSIKYGLGGEGVELLSFNPGHDAYPGEFDSGTTCLLLPNSTAYGYLGSSPFQKLLDLQLQGIRRPLVYTMVDEEGKEQEYSIDYQECVEPSKDAMILGDAFFRKFLVLHDLTNLKKKRIGLARRNPAYELNANPSVPELVAAKTASLANGNSQRVQKLAAKRQVRQMARFDMLDEGEKDELHKVPLVSPTRVVYNVGIGVGTPPQPMEVIFDTGSYMLAVFAKGPPEGMIPIGMKHRKESLRRTVAKIRDLEGLKGLRKTTRAQAVHAERANKLTGVKGIQAQRKREVAATLRKRDQGSGTQDPGIKGLSSQGSPEEVKAALIRKALRKIRRSQAAGGSGVEAKLPGVPGGGVSMLQVGASRGAEGFEDLENYVNGVEGPVPQPLKVARVPALVGINAVLVAAVVVLVIRFKSARGRRRSRSSDDYGTLAGVEGAEQL